MFEVVGAREDVLRNRVEHRYSGVSNFEVPVVVSGTTRVLNQVKELVVVENPSVDAMESFINDCFGIEGSGAVDGRYGIRRVGGIGRVRVVRESSTELVLGVEGDSRLYYVGVGDSGGQGLKAYAGLLGVPYSYIRKTPASLSRRNFDYLCGEKGLDEKCGAVDLVYCVDSDELRYEDGVGGVEVLECHRVVNVLKVKGVKGASVAVGGEDVLFSEVYARYGVLLEELDRELFGLNVEARLQSYCLDYEVVGGGRNFVRLLLGGEGCSWEIGGEKWELSLTLSGDVSGKGVGKVRVGFGMFREVCRNGVGVNLDGVGLLEARDRFISARANELGGEGAVEGYGLEFMSKLGGEGLEFGVKFVNGGMVGSYIGDALRFFIGLGGDLGGMLGGMGVEFEWVSGEEFVKVCEEEWGFSKGVLKVFMLEYVAGELGGERVFRSGLDVLNYLTFVCRSFGLKDMLEVEGGAMDYVNRVAGRLGGDIHISGEGSVIGYEGWSRKVNKSLL